LLLPRWGVFWGVAPNLRALPKVIAVSPLGFLSWRHFSIIAIFIFFKSIRKGDIIKTPGPAGQGV